MKASVITLHTVNNYGSVLQTYATSKILNRLGYEVEFIDYWRQDNLPEFRAQKLLESNILKKFECLWGINQITRSTTVSFLAMMLKHRKSVMQKFLDKNVCMTPHRYTSYKDLKMNAPLADVYITGSDQVWNKIWNRGIDKAFFLDFAPKDKPKLSFAASIGREKFDKDEITETKRLLQQYKAISVREQSAVELLKSIGIQSTLILDPTLMLEAKEWKKLAENIKYNAPYLLIYQLNPNQEMDKYAIDLARKKGWDIFRIGFGFSDRGKAGKCIMLPSVEKFLGLFFNARCILTDSFHATAFSLNLGIDFISVIPPFFGTRIESILELTKTTTRILKNFNDFNICEQEINKEMVNKILKVERQKAEYFLKSNLKI